MNLKWNFQSMLRCDFCLIFHRKISGVSVDIHKDIDEELILFTDVTGFLG